MMKKLNLKSLTVQSFVTDTKSVVGGGIERSKEGCGGTIFCNSGVGGYEVCGTLKIAR